MAVCFDGMCTVLTHKRDIAARKALEAFWMSARKPSMNNSSEYLSVTNDFIPFVSTCEVWICAVPAPAYYIWGYTHLSVVRVMIGEDTRKSG